MQVKSEGFFTKKCITCQVKGMKENDWERWMGQEATRTKMQCKAWKAFLDLGPTATSAFCLSVKSFHSSKGAKTQEVSTRGGPFSADSRHPLSEFSDSKYTMILRDFFFGFFFFLVLVQAQQPLTIKRGQQWTYTHFVPSSSPTTSPLTSLGHILNSDWDVIGIH